MLVLAFAGFMVPVALSHPLSFVEVVIIIMIVANIYCNLLCARYFFKHFASIYLFNLCCVSSESAVRATERLSVSPCLGKPGSDPTPWNPKHGPPLYSFYFPWTGTLGQALHPKPLLFCGLTCRQEFFGLTSAILRHSILLPNTGAPRYSWTKGKKKSCDRCWVR